MKKFKNHKISVMGKEVQIKFVDSIYYNGQFWSRMFYPDTWIIEVATDGQNENFIKHTFLHELGHAIAYRVGLVQGNFSSDLQELVTENYATVLSELWDFEI